MEVEKEWKTHGYLEKVKKNLKDALVALLKQVGEEGACPANKVVYDLARVVPMDVADGILVGDTNAWSCSGVAVAEDMVLTAAHCLPATRVVVTEDIRSGGVIHEVVQQIRHPNPDVDAALLRTKTRVSDKPAIMREANAGSPPMGMVRFVGFGATSAEMQSGFGKKHFLDLQAAGWGCDAERANRTGCKPQFEMVLPGSEGRDTCGGDSGGPVYEIWGNGAQCGFRLIGITSRRTADSIVPCGNGGIYTRIDAIRGWIDEQVGISLANNEGG